MGMPARTIVHVVSYPLFSGPLPQTLNLALAQRDQGHRVYLAYDTKRGQVAINGFEQAAAPQIDPHSLAPPGAELYLSAKSTPLQLWRDRQTLRRLVRDGKVDVVHSHLSHDHAMVALAGVRRFAPVVRTFHASRSLVPRFGQTWVNGQADGWVLRSDDHLRRLETCVGPQRLRAGTAAVIQGSIDCQHYRPAAEGARLAARGRFGLPQEALVVAHVALIHDRGQEELALALARLEDKDVHLLYVGRGAGEGALRRAVHSAGVAARVHFAGYLEGSAALSLAYHAADVAFIAQAGNDASVRAVMEAMACGVPVLGVTDRDAAIGELVSDGRGYALGGRRPEEICSALADIVLDVRAGRAAQRGRAARVWLERHRTIAGEARRTDAFYRQTIERWAQT